MSHFLYRLVRLRQLGLPAQSRNCCVDGFFLHPTPSGSHLFTKQEVAAMHLGLVPIRGGPQYNKLSQQVLKLSRKSQKRELSWNRPQFKKIRLAGSLDALLEAVLALAEAVEATSCLLQVSWAKHKSSVSFLSSECWLYCSYRSPCKHRRSEHASFQLLGFFRFLKFRCFGRLER